MRFQLFPAFTFLQNRLVSNMFSSCLEFDFAVLCVTVFPVGQGHMFSQRVGEMFGARLFSHGFGIPKDWEHEKSTLRLCFPRASEREGGLSQGLGN